MSQRMLAVLKAVMLCVATVTTALGAITFLISFASPRGQAWAYMDSVADACISVACLLIVQSVCSPPIRRRRFLLWILKSGTFSFFPSNH